MAQPMRYIGSFADISYGIDSEGELFETAKDAVNALFHRHRDGHWSGSVVHYLNGETKTNLFPTVTNDAYLYLWRLDPEDRLTMDELWSLFESGEAPPFSLADYSEAEPDMVVWIGARQAVRHGKLEAFDEQRRVRGRQDAREAGSVVVTD
jgi:hypothetical protein